MNKLIKSLTLALVLSLAFVCAGIFMTACDKKDDDGVEKYSVYVVYADGTPVNGQTDGYGLNSLNNTQTNVTVQWCLNSCYWVYLGADGKASVKASTVIEQIGGTPTHVQVMKVTGYSENDPNGVAADVTITGTGEVKITLTAAN